MKHVQRSVLLWYSPQEMYRLVTAVQDYPQFLPWCEKTEVIESSPSGMTARLTLAYAGVRHAFTTRNEHHTDSRVIVSLVDGPFSRLDGTWCFDPLQRAQPDVPASKVSLDLVYGFAGRALELVVSPVFDRIANTLVDAFVKRAEQVYGPR